MKRPLQTLITAAYSDDVLLNGYLVVKVVVVVEVVIVVVVVEVVKE
jgi:hypothetical protein